MISLIFASCNITKYVPEGDYLLNKVKIESDTKVISKNDIKSYLRQTANSRMLGFWRSQLGIYNLSGNDSTKKRNIWLKKLGEEPVIYNSNLTAISEIQIHKYFQNKGFMSAEVTSEVTYPKKKMVNVTYIIKSGEPYRIHGYSVNIQQSKLNEIANDTSECLIKTGQLFDSDVLESERTRITKKFRNLGYFNFLKEDLHFYADSALNSHKVDLVVELSNDIKNITDTVNNPVFKRYKINSITYLSQNIKNNISSTQEIKMDSFSKGNYDFVYLNKQNIRPGVLIESTHLIPGKYYSDAGFEKTYSSLNSLSAVRYINIQFNTTDSTKLDTYITLTPKKLQSISTDVEGTFSAGYWGFGTNLNYGHNNIFGGSEALTSKSHFAYEYQGIGLNAIEIGQDLRLKFPTFLFPFTSTETKRKIGGSTEVNATLSYRQRPSEYTGVILSTGLKYSWSELSNLTHNLDLIDLSYIRYPWISQEYQNTFFTSNTNFRYNFQNHFIMRIGYNGTYTNFNQYRPLRDYSKMSYNIETAGNSLYVINKLFNNQKVQDGIQSYYTLFNVRFAQYVKLDYNITHYQIFDENNKIVYHAGFGIAVPYGNASIIPFEKRYFAGGANSVRGWTAYQLGPGTYSDSIKNYINLNTQMGDVKLDLNMEYRGKIFWKLDWALFLDAGNVWTIKNYEDQPGGAFKFDTFLGQLGIAYGAGIRFDFNYFVFRVDGGFKLYNPALSRTERWRTPPTKDDYAINLAIGYPF